MVVIEFFEETMDYSPWYSSNFRRNHRLYSMVFIEFLEEITDYITFFIKFLKNSWTIVHGFRFHQIFEEIPMHAISLGYHVHVT